MVRIALCALILMAATSVQAAGPTPESIVWNVYNHFIAQTDHFAPPYEPSESFYTPRLKALVAGSRKQAAGEAACGLDFMFWVDGQDYDIKSADVTETPGPDAATAYVVAKFVSLRTPHEIHFTFRKLAGRWRLDDAQEVLGKGWVFSTLLQCIG